jgi:ribonuclease P protein component
MTDASVRFSGVPRLRPLEPIRRHCEYSHVYDQGRKFVSGRFLLHALRRADDARPRLGLTVSRRVGKACVRNRIRRRFRESIRLLSPRIGVGWDIVLTARRGSAESSTPELRPRLEDGLRRLGVLIADD